MSGCREATHISAYDCKYGLCACFSDTRHFLQCKASCQCYFTVRPFVRCTGQIVMQEEAKISFNIGLQAQLETDLHANISFCMKCWHGDHRASPRRFYLSWCLRQRHGVLIRLGKIEASSTTIASPITVLFIDARSETY